MKRYKKVLTAAFLVALLLCLSCQTAFAFSESDAQAQVDAAGREAVSGNVLVWFLCAIAFLKVSQKIDSFMSSLGVNVGHTGGSMIAEAMIAARGVGAVRNFSRQHFGGGHSSSSSHVSAGSGSPGSPGGFMAGGLAACRCLYGLAVCGKCQIQTAGCIFKLHILAARLHNPVLVILFGILPDNQFCAVIRRTAVHCRQMEALDVHQLYGILRTNFTGL